MGSRRFLQGSGIPGLMFAQCAYETGGKRVCFPAGDGADELQSIASGVMNEGIENDLALQAIQEKGYSRLCLATELKSPSWNKSRGKIRGGVQDGQAHEP